jgi:hypothetical protein
MSIYSIECVKRKLKRDGEERGEIRNS